MTHEEVKAALAGEAPDNPEVVMHLATCADCRAYADALLAVDALARALPPMAVPPDLVDATTAAMDREIDRSARRPSRAVWGLGGGLALAAALLLFFRGPGVEVGDGDQMVERGNGTSLPEIDLRIAVVRGGSVERFNRDRAYAPGDRLQFRATTSPASSIAIFHVGPGAPVARVDGGGGDAAWEIEPTDEGAIFVGVASPAPFSDEKIVAVEGALSRAYNGDAARLCDAVTEQGLGCAATPIHVDGDLNRRGATMMVLLAMMLAAVAGVVAPEDTAAVEAAYKPRRVALLVGVQQYGDPELAGLRYPEADARDLYDVLHRQDVGGFDDAVVLVGQQNTTKRAIEEAIAWATSELQRDDTFLLYFSGHGTLSFDLVEGSQLFFLPSDAKLAEPEKTGISVAWLEKVVGSLPSRRRVLILDTCHNGRSGKSAVNSSTAQLLGAMRGPPPEPRGLRDVSESEARLYAAQYYQPALEDAHLGNGVYTHFLIQALTDGRAQADLDGDGLVEIAELHDYARDRTMKYTSGVQVPRAEYHFVGHDEIYLAGDPSLRGVAERALLSACDEILAKARLLVDGIPRGTLPGVTAIEPGRHDVKITTESGDTLVRRSVRFEAGRDDPGRGSAGGDEAAGSPGSGGPVFRKGPAVVQSRHPAHGRGRTRVHPADGDAPLARAGSSSPRRVSGAAYFPTTRRTWWAQRSKRPRAHARLANGTVRDRAGRRSWPQRPEGIANGALAGRSIHGRGRSRPGDLPSGGGTRHRAPL